MGRSWLCGPREGTLTWVWLAGPVGANREISNRGGPAGLITVQATEPPSGENRQDRRASTSAERWAESRVVTGPPSRAEGPHDGGARKTTTRRPGPHRNLGTAAPAGLRTYRDPPGPPAGQTGRTQDRRPNDGS